MRRSPSTASFRWKLALAIALATLAPRAHAQTMDASSAPESSGETGDLRQPVMDAVRPDVEPHPHGSAAQAATTEGAPPAGRSLLAPSTEKPRDAPVTPAWTGIEIVVYKSKRLLSVYRDGNFEKEFRVVLGLAPEGRKRHANDARTPEGFYHVTASRRHARWQHFLALDYPNAEDRIRYAAEVARGKIPDEDGKPFAIGGDIGIHGNDREKDQATGIDWTKGCIALAAVDIEEIAAMVPAGTPVWIVE